MFKDKLMTALNDAIENFNGGAGENEAVVKAASAHGFNPDQTQRLVESFNTAKTICFYKHADDKAATFPVADSAAVITELFGKKEDKQASDAQADDTFVDYSYYEEQHQELDKSAELYSKIDPWAGWGEQTYESKEAETNMKVAEYQGLIDAKMACENAALIAGNHYDMTIQKVAEEISRNTYHTDGILDELHTFGLAMDKMANAVVDEVFSRLPESREERKNLRITQFDRMYPMLSSSIKSAAEALKEGGVMTAQAETLEKMAKEKSVNLGISNTDEEDELDSLIPKTAQHSGIYGQMLGDLTSAVGREATGGLVSGMKKTVAGDASKKNKKFVESARNKYRQLMLERLMVTDPILKGADEQSVLRAYETLVELAPEVSLKEDVTRSILREAVTTTAMSPFDAKSYVELDAAIKKQLSAPKPEATKL
jgi:hypothetical protein